MTATRKISIVDRSEMNQDALFSAMHAVTPQKLNAVKKAVQKVVDEREAFEAVRERRLGDGSIVVGQSADIKHVQALATSDAFLRMVAALNLDPRAYIFPQSRDGGKSSTETSNLKAYRKALQVAETILLGSTNLENVVKVATVCMYRAATMRNALIERDFAETFLSSVELRTIKQASEDLWSAIDDVRAKHMTSGAQTQTSQMIRTLVALGSAVDERDGRSKNVRISPDGLVMQSLMRRFGIVSDAVEVEVQA